MDSGRCFKKIHWKRGPSLCSSVQPAVIRLLLPCLRLASGCSFPAAGQLPTSHCILRLSTHSHALCPSTLCSRNILSLSSLSTEGEPRVSTHHRSLRSRKGVVALLGRMYCRTSQPQPHMPGCMSVSTTCTTTTTESEYTCLATFSKRTVSRWHGVLGTPSRGTAPAFKDTSREGGLSTRYGKAFLLVFYLAENNWASLPEVLRLAPLPLHLPPLVVRNCAATLLLTLWALLYNSSIAAVILMIRVFLMSRRVSNLDMFGWGCCILAAACLSRRTSG